MTPREFALKVVKQLQTAGYQALWAGGCVRDQLLGIEPKDYDIATNATPEQIRDLFGQKRTLAIGASFGVITVLGPRSAGPIEVATFRRDAGYSDGRRPDAVEFTNAEEDARRRDFTINGMFFDPIEDQVIDFVGGLEDLEHRQIRAIGNPHERIHEDKLRMLRGIRFAATYGFELEPQTFDAISQHASEINVVSAERIGAEVVRMFAHESCARAAHLLVESGLLKVILPDCWSGLEKIEDWHTRVEPVRRLPSVSFESVTTILLQDWLDGTDVRRRAVELQEAWRLTNQQTSAITWIAEHWRQATEAHRKKWSEVQPMLIAENAAAAIDVAEAMVGAGPGIEFCRERLNWPSEQLDPPWLLDGQDLIELGITPGPQFKILLQNVRDAQLDGQISTAQEAKKLVLPRNS